MNGSRLLVLLLAFTIFSFGANWSETTDIVRAPASSDTDIYPYRVTSNAGHDMRVVNSGIAALYTRVDLIRRAKKTLELEYFIFNPDNSGRIILKELAKAAKRGVKVRVLVDKSMAVFVLDEYYASAFKEHNIEIRYYNPASAIQLSTVQFRNHRKLLSMDDKEAIVGGRNIGNEYFDFSETFNFLDRDSWIKGEMVKVITETFDRYWKNDRVETPKALRTPRKRPTHNMKNRGRDRARYKEIVRRHKRKIKNAQNVFAQNDEDDKLLEYAMTYGKEVFNSVEERLCPEFAFASDREGAGFSERVQSDDYHKNYRLLRKEIGKWMGKIQDEVYLDSPYFLNNKRSKKVMNDMLDANIKINILTNSLGSTDAIYVSTLFNQAVRKYTPFENFSAYVYKGQFNNETKVFNEKIAKAAWGTHSKTIVFNDDSVMIGTFNIDNRSSFYNTEMAVFCSGSKGIRDDVVDNIEFRKKGSHHLNKKGRPDDGSNLTEGASVTKKLLYIFLKVPAGLLQFLL